MQDHIKILILEDDPNDLGLILNELKKAKFNFSHEAVSSKHGFVNALNVFAPNAILSDYNLPSFDAVQAFEEKERNAPLIPFIIISGFIGEENAIELIKRGVTDYVIKDKLYSLPAKLERALKESEEKRGKKIAEAQLEESRKRLAEAQEIAKIGNWERDLINHESYWCDEVFNILGLKPGEVIPSREIFLSFIHPAHRTEVEKLILDAEKSSSDFSHTSRILRKDGSVRNVYFNGKCVINEQGTLLRQIGILQDITETKKMEEDLKAMNKELETFIYRASHDLRGPLSSIIGLTNISKNDVIDETGRKYLQMIESSALKLDATLVSLVQSMTMRDMVISLEEVDLNEIINGILLQLKYHDGFSHININTENHLRQHLHSNKLLLTSIFQNLIQNAIKYQDYRNEKAFLNIKIRSKERGTEIIFEDNGIGIAQNLQNKIFEMYFRGTSSISGSGLGLYIVKIGVDKLNGTITCESEKGKGTKFTIFIPQN